MTTVGSNFYNGGDYRRACAAWSEAVAIYADLDRRGSLSGFHKTSLADVKAYHARACENGPPRAGLGPSV